MGWTPYRTTGLNRSSAGYYGVDFDFVTRWAIKTS